MLVTIFPPLVCFYSGERPFQLDGRGWQRVLGPPAVPFASRSRTWAQQLRSSQLLRASLPRRPVSMLP